MKIWLSKCLQIVLAPSSTFEGNWRRASLLSLLLAVLPASARGEWRTQHASPPIRVGIVDYDGSTDERSREIRESFANLTSREKVIFASGTAEEVLDWVTEGSVDIAILSPGAFAATIATTTDSERKEKYQDARRNGNPPPWDCKYLITHSLLASTSTFASPSRRNAGGFLYQALCLMNKESVAELRREYRGKNDAERIKAAYDAGQVQFVFGDPLSLSSNIVPRAQLKQMRIDPNKCCEFSFGLSETLDLLDKERNVVVDGKLRHRLGFVFDGTVPSSRKRATDQSLVDKSSIIRLELPPSVAVLDKLERITLPPPEEPRHLTQIIASLRARNNLPPYDASADSRVVDDLPTEVWVVRPDFPDSELSDLREDLKQANVQAPETLHAEVSELFRDQSRRDLPNNESELSVLMERVRYWVQKAGVVLTKRETSLREICDSMRHRERVSGRGSRLALVLSGGGAKCAYQAGAIKSIERDLRTLRASLNSTSTPPSPDINLVVGTSGGALNAVPVALRLTDMDPPTDSLCKVWASIDLSALGSPELKVRILLGLLIGSFLIFLTWLLSAALRTFAWLPLLLRLACLVVIVGFLLTRHFCPSVFESGWTPSRGAYFYGCVVLDLGLVPASLVLLGGTICGEIRRRKQFDPVFEINFWRGLACIAVAALTLLLTIFLIARSLFIDEKMEQLVVTNFESLLEEPARSKDIRDRKSALSGFIRNRIKRDLVITGSRLGMNAPSDLYFFLPASSRSIEAAYGMEGRRLDENDNSTRIMDYVIASGTIFPFFPPHPVEGMENEHDDLTLVDGGFAHNTPVEAAAKWGATHIIMIEASPEFHEKAQNSFGGNLLAAYYHLFGQAQLTDMRSREGLEIYSLRPQNEILGILDFDRHFTEKAARQGEDDASAGTFHQYSRPPQFKEELHDLGDLQRVN